MNTLATAGEFNGETPASISNDNPTAITPSGYAFSIWSIIFLGLLGTLLYQTLGFKSENVAMDIIPRVSVYWILSALCQIVWLLVWHYGLPNGVVWPSMLAMTGILVTNVIAYYRMARNRHEVEQMNWIVYISSHVPWSLYSAWVSGAFLINVLLLLRAPSHSSWGCFLGIVGLLLYTGFGIYWAFQKGDLWYVLFAVENCMCVEIFEGYVDAVIV